MWDAPGPHLAVAVLTESGGTAAAYRHRPDRPVHGYCLITGDERQYRVHLFLRGARPLTGRSAYDRFYYEGWALAGAAPVSLGAFNTGDGGDGDGAFARTIEAPLVGLATLIRITAEPFGGSHAGHTPVLEGKLVWIQGRAGGSMAPAPAPEPALAMALAAQPHAPWAGLLAGAGQPVATMPGGGGRPGPAEGQAAEPSRQREPEPEAVAAAEPEPGTAPEAEAELMAHVAGAGADPDPDPEPEPEREPEPAKPPCPHAEDEPGFDEPAVHPFKLVPEPARLVSVSPDSEAKVPLKSMHPMAPRAGGSAQFTSPDGGLQVTLWGLPTPALLGKEKSTNRPYNAYRVWLQNPRTGQRTPLGLAARTWGENYRFQTDGPLPDSGSGTLLVTPHDRGAESPDPGAPQVVAGDLRSL